MDEPRLELYCGLGGLDHLAPDWHRLFDQLGDSSFAQSWEWHRGFLEHLAPQEEALYVALREGREITAIIPLFRSSSNIAAVPCTVLKLPTHDHMPYADIVAPPGWMRSRPLNALLDQLEARIGAFDALVLSPVLEHSAASELAWAPDVLTASEPAGHSDALPALTFEKLLARMSGNFRSTLSRSRKKLERLNGARVSCADRPDQLEVAFAHFLKIEASGWKGAAGTRTAIALDPRLHDFYRQLVQRLGQTGQCEIHMLDVDLTPVAAQLGLVFGRRYYQIKIGYDEAWAHLGPGNALLEHVLKSYANHPRVKYVDLVSGADWHEHWRPDVRHLVDRFVFRPSARGRLAWATLRGKQALRPVRKLLTEKLATLRDSGAPRAPG